MAQFRRKSNTIEAFQMHYCPGANWNAVGKDKWPSWFREAVFREEGTENSVYLHANGLWVIWTQKGIMEINPGDYVIRGVKGELFPQGAAVFESIYDEA